MEQEWLEILRSFATEIAVADMAYSHLAGELCDLLLIENLIDKTLALYTVKFTFGVNGYDSATLLTSVLKGVQAIVSQACSILDTVDSKHTTFVVEFVVSIFFTITHFSSFSLSFRATGGSRGIYHTDFSIRFAQSK